MPGEKEEMGAVLPCGRKSNKLIPKKGKTQPTPPPKKPKTYALKVEVRSGGKKVSGAKVAVDGATVTSNSSGIASFGKKPEGKYEIKVTFDTSSDYVDLANPVSISHAADSTVPVSVEMKNFVSAKIETEYKALVYDRKLSDLQDGGEEKIVTGNSCYIEVSFEQTNTSFEYKKTAKLACAGAGAVDFFTDEACKTAFDGTIPKSVIVSGRPVKYYLKAKTAGKFNLSVTLEDPADPKVKVKQPKVEEAMSVCEIKLNLFRQDIDAIKSKKIVQDLHPVSKYHSNLKKYEIPEQKELTNSDKVKKGRYLHVQNNGANGRAKVLLKIDTAQWPDECNEYQLFLSPTCASGTIDLYDAEWKGTKWDKATPIKIGDLKKKKGEKIFWVEGTGATNKVNDVVLGVNLNRPAKGLAHKEKKNADWGRFTVVQIQEVKLNYQAGVGEASAWDDSKKLFYVNFKTGLDGRKIKIKAKLSKAIAGVPIHFMLAGDKDNGKAANWGIDMPSKWKWNEMDAVLKQKDRTNRDDFLHLQKETDVNGEAEMELTLSRIGGEKFVPACYISEDAHLAKYIHGHSDLEKQKPVLSATTIRVWRKFWIQPIRPHVMGAVSLTDSVNKYAAANVEMKALDDIELDAGEVAVVPKAIYKEYMVKTGGGNTDKFVATDYNMHHFYAKVTPDADKPIKVPMLLCQANFGDAGVSGAVNNIQVRIDAFPREVQTNMCALTPCIDDNAKDLMASGEWRLFKKDATNTWQEIESGDLQAADVTIVQTRTNKQCVRINKPSNITNRDADTLVVIDNFTINGAKSFLGGYFSDTKTLLSVYDPSSPNDFHNTIVHELGHAFSQVIRPADTTSLGLPRHPLQEDRGSGNHCNHKASSKFDCVMYYAGLSGDPVLKWCDVCKPYVLATDMAELS